MPIHDLLAHLAMGRSLSYVQARELFDELLQGRLEPAHVAAALAMIRVRGASLDEVHAGAVVMRSHATSLPVDDALRSTLLDTCGTGGAPKTFNVSTLAAIVVAAAAPGRVRVAKHGNRSRTGRGSAEVLAGLGVDLDAPPTIQARCLREAGVCFCFAVNHHPAMRHAGAVRAALGFPTIFNMLGPLTNPAGAPRQLLGVAEEAALPLMAGSLQRLGVERAWVVRSHDGLDELSITAPTRVLEVDRGGVREMTVDAAVLGLRPARLEELRAEDLSDAVRIAWALLDGEPGPRRDMLLLSVGAALVVGGVCEGVREGIELGARAIDSGAARETLVALSRVSRER